MRPSGSTPPRRTIPLGLAYSIFAILTLSSPGKGCSSAGSKSSRVEVSNDIETLPPVFFTVINDDAKERSLCPKSLALSSCKIIRIDVAALAAPKMNFPIPFPESSVTSEIVLKKTTEEGLKMVLSDPASPATATVTYKFKNQNVAVIVKQGKAFASLVVDGKIMMKPCPEFEALNCHILIFKKKPT